MDCTCSLDKIHCLRYEETLNNTLTEITNSHFGAKNTTLTRLKEVEVHEEYSRTSFYEFKHSRPIRDFI